jgi:3,4-dihydroxy 2-butanone 4-phosphate synthase/GTP cyclohydrolase II
MKTPFDTIESALHDVKHGKMIIVTDSEDRENEGDLVMAAEFATPEAINFMATHGRGLICLPLTEEKAKTLGLVPMTSVNTDAFKTAFVTSIDALESTTGISAFERSHTIQKAVLDAATAGDFKTPGHVFPLTAKKGGTLVRAGHTEAAVDLALLAGLKPAGVICEILKDDGTMARVDDLIHFKEKHRLKLISIADLIDYRLQKESLIQRSADAKMPTLHGNFEMVGYENTLTGEHHVALVKGDVRTDEPVLVRVHSECLTGEAFGSLRCDCGPQLEKALSLIESAGKGVLLYMRQEGRGIGLINKIRAYHLQDDGLNTLEANHALGFEGDLRTYGVGAQILKDLGIQKMHLLTNNPRKISGLEGFGLTVEKRIPIEIESHSHNDHYLKTKKEKMGHLLSLEEK